MPDIKSCFNEKCKHNRGGCYCDGADIVINADGCCEDFEEMEEAEDGLES